METNDTKTRDTRESVEDDYRYSETNALLDAFLLGELTLHEVACVYLEEFPDQVGRDCE